MQVRRAPLPLVLLWLHYVAQAEGMETWWKETAPATQDAAALHARIAALRAEHPRGGQ